MAEESKIKALAGSVSHEGPLPGSNMAVLFLCPHMAERAREVSGSLRMTLIPFMSAPPL